MGTNCIVKKINKREQSHICFSKVLRSLRLNCTKFVLGGFITQIQIDIKFNNNKQNTLSFFVVQVLPQKYKKRPWELDSQISS